MDYRIRVKKGNIELEVQGTQEFVESKYEELKEVLDLQISDPQEATPIPAPPREESPQIELPDNIVSFLRLKGNPKTNLKRNMIFAYWLNEHGTEEFTSEPIDALYDAAKLRVPAKTARDMATLQGRGLLLSRGKEGHYFKYALSADGIRDVEEMT